MGTIVHTSRISIVREKGPTRIARIEGFPEPCITGFTGRSRISTRSSRRRSTRRPWTTSSGPYLPE